MASASRETRQPWPLAANDDGPEEYVVGHLAPGVTWDDIRYHAEAVYSQWPGESQEHFLARVREGQEGG